MSVQQTIIRGIKEQLFFNNYLVLPNFGGFVLKSNPSHFAASGGLLVPPSKTVSFNAQLKQNDGILVLWLQNTLKCHASEALTHLNDFSEFCKGVLNAKRRLSLEGIGFFYLDFENNVCFEPQPDANFLSQSFGLTAVSIKQLEPEIIELKREPVFVDRTQPITQPVLAPIRRKGNYSGVMIPLLILVLFVSLLGLLVNNSFINGELRSSFTGGESSGIYVPIDYEKINLPDSKSEQRVYVADINGIADIELEGIKKLPVRVAAAEFNPAVLNHTESKLHLHSGKFEIVLGCFAILDNAKRMVHKLSSKNIDASVSGKNNKGMYVVSKGKYSTKEEAVNRLIEVKENFPNAWIKNNN